MCLPSLAIEIPVRPFLRKKYTDFRGGKYVLSPDPAVSARLGLVSALQQCQDLSRNLNSREAVSSFTIRLMSTLANWGEVWRTWVKLPELRA